MFKIFSLYLNGTVLVKKTEFYIIHIQCSETLVLIETTHIHTKIVVDEEEEKIKQIESNRVSNFFSPEKIKINHLHLHTHTHTNPL